MRLPFAFTVALLSGLALFAPSEAFAQAPTPAGHSCENCGGGGSSYGGSTYVAPDPEEVRRREEQEAREKAEREKQAAEARARAEREYRQHKAAYEAAVARGAELADIRAAFARVYDGAQARAGRLEVRVGELLTTTTTRVQGLPVRAVPVPVSAPRYVQGTALEVSPTAMEEPRERMLGALRRVERAAQALGMDRVENFTRTTRELFEGYSGRVLAIIRGVDDGAQEVVACMAGRPCDPDKAWFLDSREGKSTQEWAADTAGGQAESGSGVRGRRGAGFKELFKSVFVTAKDDSGASP